MAISLQEAIAIASELAGDTRMLSEYVKYGPLTEGYAQMYEFRWVDGSPTPNDGHICTFLIDEVTGKNVASCAFSSLPPGDYEVFDFDGNVIRSREEVRAAWDVVEEKQAELEAQAEAEWEESVGPVPVTWDDLQGKFV